MIDILLTIILFNVLIVLFKLFPKFDINNLQAIIVNYFVAGTCSLLFSDKKYSFTEIIHSDWIYHASIVGLLFIITFNLYATGAQKVGIAITTIANKLSLLIPVGFALYLYPNESFGYFKLIGFILAIIGIYLSSTKGGELNFDKKYIPLIILVFAGQGIADVIFNHAQRTAVSDSEKGVFFMILLFTAGLGGLLFFIVKQLKQKSPIKFKSIIAGVLLGIPNFACLIFFFNALESSGLDASQVFPVVSMGVVILSALIGLVSFKEKLTISNWVGLLFAIMSIYFITFLGK